MSTLRDSNDKGYAMWLSTVAVKQPAQQDKPKNNFATRIIVVIKGILHQKNFYRLNLIFWIVMGCGIARFGRRGLKTTETWKFWSQNLSPGVLRRGAMGFRGAAPMIKHFSDLSFCAVPRGPW